MMGESYSLLYVQYREINCFRKKVVAQCKANVEYSGGPVQVVGCCVCTITIEHTHTNILLSKYDTV